MSLTEHTDTLAKSAHSVTLKSSTK